MIFDIYYQDNGEFPSQPYTYPWLPKKSSLPSRSGILHAFKQNVVIDNAELPSIKWGIYSNKWTKDNHIVDPKNTIRIG